MTPMQSAARAEIHQIRPNSLRIREAEPTPSDASPGRHTVYEDTLHSAWRYLQAGWRWLERKRTQQLSSRRLRVSETISLGEKRSVSIVQVDGAQYLIGCSTGSVQLLAVLDRSAAGAKDPVDSEVAS